MKVLRYRWRRSRGRATYAALGTVVQNYARESHSDSFWLSVWLSLALSDLLCGSLLLALALWIDLRLYLAIFGFIWLSLARFSAVYGSLWLALALSGSLVTKERLGSHLWHASKH